MTAVVAALLSGALYAASVQVGPIWPLAWLAPLPVLWLAYGRWRARSVALAAFGAFALGLLPLVWVYREVFPLAMMVGILVFLGLVFMAVVLASRWVARRLPGPAAALVFPALWTSWEFVLSRLSDNGTAISIAYSQTRFLPLVQIASVTGILGITFLLCLVPSTLALGLHADRRSRGLLVIPCIALTCALGFGGCKLGKANPGPVVRVGLASAESPRSELREPNAERTMAIAAQYVDRIRRLAATGATVIVLPELAITVAPDWAAQARAVFAEAAGRLHVTVVVGIDEWLANEEHVNLAAVFGPAGTIRREYVKQHNFPGEQLRRGTELGTLDDGFATAICKDLDFPDLGRAYGRADTRLMLVPAWDFGGDGFLHAEMAWMRGIENGYAMVRTARDGLLSVTDARGRLLAEARSEGPETMLLADVRLGTGTTIYALVGDVFGALACALAAVLVAIAMAIAIARRAAGARVPSSGDGT